MNANFIACCSRWCRLDISFVLQNNFFFIKHIYIQTKRKSVGEIITFHNDFAKVFFSRTLVLNCIHQSIYKKSEREILNFQTATKSV